MKTLADHIMLYGITN